MKLDFAGAARTVFALGRKHAPGILQGLGIGGFVATTVLAVRATPKALAQIDAARKEKGRELNRREKVAAAWKSYILPASTGALSTICMISSCRMSHRRNAALAAAYSITETALHEYKDKVVETVGERKEKTIRDAVDAERVERNPPTPSEIAYAEGSGRTLCYDAMFGRYFYSDRETLEQAANRLNRQMSTMAEPYISLNEFYMEIGLPTIEMGNRLGWNVSRALIKLDFTAQLINGRTPCMVMSYDVMPDYDYV